MQIDSPLFDKVHRARFAEKLSALIKIAQSMQTLEESTNRDALLVAIPRLYRRAATVVGVYGFGLEAQRIDLLLGSRRPTLLVTRDGKSIDAIAELVQLLEDLLFLAADDTSKLPPLVAPVAPKVPPITSKPMPSKPLPAKPAPTLKLPKQKKSKRR
jgi:hypothetical protein